MASLNSFRGHQIVVQISDDDGTTYAHPAIINGNRALSFSAEAESDELVDTADQSKPASMARFVRATDFKIDGAGTAQKGQMEYWANWLISGEHKPIKAICDDATYDCVMILTSFQISADRGKYAEFTATLELAEGGVTVSTSV